MRRDNKTARVKPTPRHARLAFRSARVRVGVDRFELSMWSGFGVMPGTLYAALCGGFFIWPVGGWAAVPLVALACGCRVSFSVSATSSWATWSVVGIPYRRRDLGKWPSIETSGWGWSEIALVPLDPARRKGLHDDERVVMAEWDDDNAAGSRDASVLIALAVKEIDRLHGRRPEPRTC